jgi:hypothetical protein
MEPPAAVELFAGMREPQSPDHMAAGQQEVLALLLVVVQT